MAWLWFVLWCIAAYAWAKNDSKVWRLRERLDESEARRRMAVQARDMYRETLLARHADACAEADRMAA